MSEVSEDTHVDKAEAWDALTSRSAEVNRLRKAIIAALAKLDASLFTNSEHAQAKEILRETVD